jgi:hypothetical protein
MSRCSRLSSDSAGLRGATNTLASYQSRTRDGRPWLICTWLTWLGPVLLLLGIGLAGTANLFAI